MTGTRFLNSPSLNLLLILFPLRSFSLSAFPHSHSNNSSYHNPSLTSHPYLTHKSHGVKGFLVQSLWVRNGKNRDDMLIWFTVFRIFFASMVVEGTIILPSLIICNCCDVLVKKWRENWGEKCPIKHLYQTQDESLIFLYLIVELSRHVLYIWVLILPFFLTYNSLTLF